MSDEALPEEVEELVRRYIRSVAQLEAAFIQIAAPTRSKLSSYSKLRG